MRNVMDYSNDFNSFMAFRSCIYNWRRFNTYPFDSCNHSSNSEITAKQKSLNTNLLVLEIYNDLERLQNHNLPFATGYLFINDLLARPTRNENKHY
ncbi:MAG: hypothetical protein FD141_801 [Fusobacteria bacterium]|nr:MAG: hypothetical protein FD141_801 [Fusobacteriota bacterium]KAF0228533.1 MAG: hypothetical protein FD182_789 [Fusobacteriota bacterium]